MAKKVIDKDVEELKKHLKADKIVIGSEQVLKGLKKNIISKVYAASNCKDSADMEKYSKLNNTTLVKLKYPNNELGVICRKPFSISALGILR